MAKDKERYFAVIRDNEGGSVRLEIPTPADGENIREVIPDGYFFNIAREGLYEDESPFQRLIRRLARVFRHLRQWYWRGKAQWRRKQNGRRWLEKARVALYARAYPDAFEFANQGLYCLRDAVETRAVQRLRKQLLDVRQKALRTMQASPVLIGK